LSLLETRSYVAERLHSAGLTVGSPFCSKSIELIHSYSQGVPRLINQVCDGALVIGFAKLRKEIQPDIVEECATQLQLSVEPFKESTKPAVQNDDMSAARTVVDLLIEAMKQRRASALE